MDDYSTDLFFLRSAIQLAIVSKNNGEDPFGAVLVFNNEIVYRSTDKTIEYSDPSSHAELVVISEYCRREKKIYLTDYTLYCSTEPCAMCAGLIKSSKLSKVVFSVPQSIYQKIKCGINKLSCNDIVNFEKHRAEIIGPLLLKEGMDVFRDYLFMDKETKLHLYNKK